MCIRDRFWIDQKGATQYVSYVTKYLSPVTVRYDAENDWPILRFADVLLMCIRDSLSSYFGNRVGI